MVTANNCTDANMTKEQLVGCPRLPANPRSTTKRGQRSSPRPTKERGPGYPGPLSPSRLVYHPTQKDCGVKHDGRNHAK